MNKKALILTCLFFVSATLLNAQFSTSNIAEPGTPLSDSPVVILNNGMECPLGGIPEAEPCGEDYNGGCNMGTPTFEAVNPGYIICGTTWAGDGTRDTDWFEMVLAVPTHLVLRAEAEALMYFFHLSPTNCGSTGVVAQMTVNPGTPNSLDLGVLEPGVYWFWAGLTDFYGYPCDVKYILEFDATPQGQPAIPLSGWALFLGALLILGFTILRKVIPVSVQVP